MSPPGIPGRLRVAPLLAVVVLALGCALAQRVQITGGVPAVFLPTSDAVVAAVGCSPPDCLEPLAPATQLKILRERRSNRPVLRGWRTAWAPSDDIELFVRYRVDGNLSAPFTTGWFELGSAPTELFGTSDANTRVEVEYQVRLLPQAPAGRFQTEVRYDGGPGSGTVSHVVTVDVAPIIVLQIEGAPIGVQATIAFDYTPSPLSYLDAIDGDGLLRSNGGDLVRVEVFSNHPGGFEVSVAVAQVANLDGNQLPAGVLLLEGVPAESWTYTSDRPTDGFETLLIAADYLLAVDGGEDPGNYRFTLTFTAETTP